MTCLQKNLSLLFLALFLLTGRSFGQFVAEMKNVIQGRETNYRVSSDGSQYRYDFDMGGEPAIVIVNQDEKKTYILVPEKKFVHTTEVDSRMSLMNDPVQAFKRYMDTYEVSKKGNEKMSGFNTEIIEVSTSGAKIYTCWMSEELNFPIKLVNEQGKDTYMVLSNIEKKQVDASLFVIPADFAPVDDRMRPIIPEPPAPETWNETVLTVPFSKVLKRGDKVSFSINYPQYTLMHFENKTDQPTKILYHEFNAAGEKKTWEEQGIDRLRTYRLFQGEFKDMTNAFKEGETVVLEVFEGEINVDVKADK